MHGWAPGYSTATHCAFNATNTFFQEEDPSQDVFYSHSSSPLIRKINLRHVTWNARVVDGAQDRCKQRMQVRRRLRASPPVSGPATSPQQSRRFSQSYVFSLCRVLVINEGLLFLGKDPERESMERTLDPSPGSPSAPNQMWCKEVHGEMCWLRYQPCHPAACSPKWTAVV